MSKFEIDPALRPWKRRTASRVVMIDQTLADPQILLLRDSDPGVPGVTWWVTPGGGIDPGEDPLQAAVREVWEETGHRADPADFLGPVAHRVVRHGYSDQVLEQEEWFFVLPVPTFEVSHDGHTLDEQLTLSGERWWPISELATTREWVWPATLLQMLQWADQPQTWPVELGVDTSESTVEVTQEPT